MIKENEDRFCINTFIAGYMEAYGQEPSYGVVVDAAVEQLKADARTSELNRQSLWADSVKMADELNYLKAKTDTEISQLKSKLANAKKALEYYGDKNNWFKKDDSICIDDDDTELSDYVNQLGADEYGGKTARQALKEISEG